MMRRWQLLLAVVMLFPLFSAAADTAPKYKGVEVKHFTGAEGVELTAEFYDFLYADLKSELQKSKLFEQILGEGEVIEPGDAPKSTSLQGSVNEYKKGSVVKESLIGFGAGRRSLKAHIKLTRVGDNTALLDKELTVKTMARWDNKLLARELAKHIARELKDALQ